MLIGVVQPKMNYCITLLVQGCHSIKPQEICLALSRKAKMTLTMQKTVISKPHPITAMHVFKTV